MLIAHQSYYFIFIIFSFTIFSSFLGYPLNLFGLHSEIIIYAQCADIKSEVKK